MRPLYEASEHVAKELELAAYFCNRFGCVYEQYQPMHPLNGRFLLNGVPTAVAEIKVRNNKSNKYPSLMLSASKWRKGLEWAHIENAPFILLVNFFDGVFMTKVQKDYTEGIGGRTDRNDIRDIERCAYIPMDSFLKI